MSASIKKLIIGVSLALLVLLLLAPGIVGLGLERWAQSRLAEFHPQPEYSLDRGWRRSRLEVRFDKGSTLIAHARHAPLNPLALASFEGRLLWAERPEPVALTGRLSWSGKLSLSAAMGALDLSGDDWAIYAYDLTAHVSQGPALELHLAAAHLTLARAGAHRMDLERPDLALSWRTSDAYGHLSAALVATRPGRPGSRLELALDQILLEPLAQITDTVLMLASDSAGRINHELAALTLSSAWSALAQGGLTLESLALSLDEAFHLTGHWRFGTQHTSNRIEGQGARQTLTYWAILIVALSTGRPAGETAREVERILAELEEAGILQMDAETVIVDGVDD